MSKSNGECSKTRKKLHKQATSSKNSSKETDRRIFVLPDKCTSSSNAIVSLRDPHTGEGRKYLLTYDEHDQDVVTICEILQFSEKPSSWFVGETVQKDGSLFMCTPVDPLFLILPYLVKSAKGRYVLLSQILEDHEFPHIAKLESCIDEDQLKNICDTKTSTVITSGTLYRYSEDKTLAWLKKKIDKLVTTMQEEQVDIGGSSKSQLLKRNSNQRNNTADYKNYAASLVSSYLPLSLSKNFASDAKSEPDCEIAEPASKRKKVNVNPDNPTEDYYTKFNMAQSSKATQSAKLTPAQKALAKVGKNNTKLTKFFGKKTQH